MFDFENDHETPYYGDSMPEFNMASFMEMPSIFLQGLTPERVQARSQLYRIAFEKAREAAARKASDRHWMKKNGLTCGDGI
jgi:hypothetical protein